MKNLRKISVLTILIFSIAMNITSCTRKREFEFLHDTSEISKIEIVDFGFNWSTSHGNIPIASYSIDDIDAFLSDFKQVECLWGEISVTDYSNTRGLKITYLNGDYDYITVWQNAAYNESGEIDRSDMWCFDEKQFFELLEKYSPPRYSGDIIEYNFMYAETEITQIDIVDASGGYNDAFPFIENSSHRIDDIQSFIYDFREVECRKGGWARWENLRTSSIRIIKVTYSTGEYEYIAADGYLQHRNEDTFDSGRHYLTAEDCKCFNEEQFSALIEKYSK